MPNLQRTIVANIMYGLSLGRSLIWTCKVLRLCLGKSMRLKFVTRHQIPSKKFIMQLATKHCDNLFLINIFNSKYVFVFVLDDFLILNMIWYNLNGILEQFWFFHKFYLLLFIIRLWFNVTNMYYKQEDMSTKYNHIIIITQIIVNPDIIASR